MRGLVAVLALSACGRVGFDGAASHTGDDANPMDSHDGGSLAGFDPNHGNCAAANAGPFREVGRYATTDGARGIWTVNGYVIVASANAGLDSLSFDGSTFTQRDHLDSLGWVETLWPVGDTLFVSAPGTGLYAVRLGPDGSLTKLGEETNIFTQPRQVWGTATELYVPNGSQGLFTVSFDGTTFTIHGSALASSGWSEHDWFDGTYHYFSDTTSVRILDHDGSGFTERRTALTSGNGFVRVWGGRNGELFATTAAGVTAFRYDGTVVTIDNSDISHTMPSPFVWFDGVHLFVSGSTEGTFAYTFGADGVLHQIDVTNTDGDNVQVIGDGTYIYVAGMFSQVIAYAGFECTALD